MEDIYIAMLANRLKVSIQDYRSHYLSQMPPWDFMDKLIDEKTSLLLKSNISNVYFLYENKFFKYFWNIFVTNGSIISQAI
jgi:hypothetical protein